MLLLAIWGCTDRSYNAVTFFVQPDQSIPAEDISGGNIVEQIKLTSTGISGSFTSFVVSDSVLYCGNLRAPKLLSVYNLKTGKLLNDLIERGPDSTQGLSVESLYLKKGKLWVHDITGSKLFAIKEERLGAAGAVPETIFLNNALKNMISPIAIDDTTFVATTFTHQDCRYIYASLDNTVRKAGSLPEVKNPKKLKDPPDTKVPNITYAFKAKLAKHPSNGKTALFYSKTDRAEFYSGDSIRKVITGPDGFGPRMRVEKLRGGYSVNDDEKIQYAYISISPSEEGVYCLYAGNTSDKEYGKRIFFFDWNGKLQKTLLLDRPAAGIFFDAQNKTIYCYSDTDNTIYSGKI